MKANVPEKIYLLSKPYIMLDGWYRDKSPIPASFQQIEYTRTDAFIEKAVEWLMENVEKHISADGEYTIYYKEMFEDFVNYMKGE